MLYKTINFIIKQRIINNNFLKKIKKVDKKIIFNIYFLFLFEYYN